MVEVDKMPKLFTGSHDDPYLTASMDNVLAWKMGEVLRAAATQNANAGDLIDSGLILRRVLEENGFLVTVKDHA